MQEAIPIFPKLTALDAIGRCEVLQRLPDSEVVFIGHDRGNIRSDNGFLGLAVDAVFEDVSSPDVIVFPGGVGTRPLMKDERVLAWLRQAHETSRFTTSVCTGALVLGAAGLLNGLDATTHWGPTTHWAGPVSTPSQPASLNTSTAVSSPQLESHPVSTWRCV